MSDAMRELTFEDILVLKRIEPDTVVERFSSKINASFFEAANMLGKLKLKGYVDIEATPGLSKVWLTEGGKTILKMVEERGGADLDALDVSILRAISAGANTAPTVAKTLNIRHSDLAFHMYRLLAHDLIDYGMQTTKAGWDVTVMLTEAGFHHLNAAPAPATQEAPEKKEAQKSGGIMDSIFKPRQPPKEQKRERAGPQRAPTIADELSPGMDAKEAYVPLTPDQLKVKIAREKKGKSMKKWLLYAVAAIIIVIVAAIILLYR